MEIRGDDAVVATRVLADDRRRRQFAEGRLCPSQTVAAQSSVAAVQFVSNGMWVDAIW